MIYAELQYDQHYSEIHDELVQQLLRHFPDIENGLQGDSWITVFANGETVTIDTFYSMKHQVKAENPQSKLAKRIIEVLAEWYAILEFDDPEIEPHEAN